MSWHEYNIYSKTYTEGSNPFDAYYENPLTDEHVAAKCPAKCIGVDPHFESGN